MIGSLLLGASAALGATAVGVGYAAMRPTCQWFGEVRWRGDPAGPRRIALTFDDGPTPGKNLGATERVLEILAHHDVPACFFCIGRNAEQAPDLVRAIDDAGHVLANHSYDHARHGAFHGRRYWFDQLQRTNAAIHRAAGKTPALFRPPMGVKTPRVLYAANTLGMTSVAWTHRGFDTRCTRPARITERLTHRLTPGSVLVLHDGTEPTRQRDAAATLEALPQVIETAKQVGYTFARLDEVLGVKAYSDSG